MNCGRTAAKIMNALGFDTPTTKPCRTARGSRQRSRRYVVRDLDPATVPDRLHAEEDQVGSAEQLQHREHRIDSCTTHRGPARRGRGSPAGRGCCRAPCRARRRGRRPAPGRSRTPRSDRGSRSAPGRRRRRRAAVRGRPSDQSPDAAGRAPAEPTRQRLRRHAAGTAAQVTGRRQKGRTRRAVPLPATRVITSVPSCSPCSDSRRRSSSGTTSTPRFLIVSRPMPRARSAALSAFSL